MGILLTNKMAAQLFHFVMQQHYKLPTGYIGLLISTPKLPLPVGDQHTAHPWTHPLTTPMASRSS